MALNFDRLVFEEDGAVVIQCSDICELWFARTHTHRTTELMELAGFLLMIELSL